MIYIIIFLTLVIIFLEVKLRKDLQCYDKEFENLKNSIKENRDRILVNKEKLDKIKDNG